MCYTVQKIKCKFLNSTHLHSTEVDTCIVPRIKTRFGDGSFTVAIPWLWNSLPTSLHHTDTQFKRLLKTYLVKLVDTAVH